MAHSNTLARRSILGGALATSAAVLPVAPVAADPAKDAADKLLAAMQARHGGVWSVHIDHDTGFALIRAHGELPGKPAGGAA
jgi:hypothetical protein